MGYYTKHVINVTWPELDKFQRAFAEKELEEAYRYVDGGPEEFQTEPGKHYEILEVYKNFVHKMMEEGMRFQISILEKGEEDEDFSLYLITPEEEAKLSPKIIFPDVPEWFTGKYSTKFW